MIFLLGRPTVGVTGRTPGTGFGSRVVPADRNGPNYIHSWKNNFFIKNSISVSFLLGTLPQSVLFLCKFKNYFLIAMDNFISDRRRFLLQRLIFIVFFARYNVVNTFLLFCERELGWSSISGEPLPLPLSMTELTPAGQSYRPVYCRVFQVNPCLDSSCCEQFTGRNAMLWMMPIRIQLRVSVLMPIRIRIRNLLQVMHKSADPGCRSRSESDRIRIRIRFYYSGGGNTFERSTDNA